MFSLDIYVRGSILPSFKSQLCLPSLTALLVFSNLELEGVFERQVEELYEYPELLAASYMLELPGGNF